GPAHRRGVVAEGGASHAGPARVVAPRVDAFPAVHVTGVVAGRGVAFKGIAVVAGIQALGVDGLPAGAGLGVHGDAGSGADVERVADGVGDVAPAQVDELSHFHAPSRPPPV